MNRATRSCFSFVMTRLPPTSTLFPYTTLFRSGDVITQDRSSVAIELETVFDNLYPLLRTVQPAKLATTVSSSIRSEEHTSELQSHVNLVCRLLLEKKKQRSLDRFKYDTELIWA